MPKASAASAADIEKAIDIAFSIHLPDMKRKTGIRASLSPAEKEGIRALYSRGKTIKQLSIEEEISAARLYRIIGNRRQRDLERNSIIRHHFALGRSGREIAAIIKCTPSHAYLLIRKLGLRKNG